MKDRKLKDIVDSAIDHTKKINMLKSIFVACALLAVANAAEENGKTFEAAIAGKAVCDCASFRPMS